MMRVNSKGAQFDFKLIRNCFLLYKKQVQSELQCLWDRIYHDKDISWFLYNFKQTEYNIYIKRGFEFSKKVHFVVEIKFPPPV